MREMSFREANLNFLQVIAAAEAGETIIITKNGLAVARISPHAADRGADPAWVKSHAALEQSLRRLRVSISVGAIAEEDLYGDDA
jgi:prevent-host-death family protein